MPHIPTGNRVGRPGIYRDDDRPITISLRVPHALAIQARRYAARHRQSLTELLLDGLQWRLGEGDPQGIGLPALPPAPYSDKEYYENTITAHDPLLADIRALVVEQSQVLQSLAQAITRGAPGDRAPERPYNGNTAIPPAGDGDQGTAQTPDYDHTRFQLGPPCKRGHFWPGTEQTLREVRQGKGMGDCAACHRERARASKAQRTGTRP